MENIRVKNRPSPSNEDEWREAYKKANPDAEKKDGLDIGAVVTETGVKGHALIDESYNRSKDESYYVMGYDFIPDYVLAFFM